MSGATAIPVNIVARTRRFVVLSQADLGRPVLVAKIFRFTRRANHLYKFAPSHPTRGAYRDRHETRGADAVDAAAFCVRRDCRVGDELMSDQQHADERCCSVRRSRVVLTPRRWCQVRGVASALPGLDKTYPQMTVARQPGHRGATVFLR